MKEGRKGETLGIFIEGVICINLETSLREIYVVSYLEGGIGLSRGIRIKMGRREGKKKVCARMVSCASPRR